MRNYKSDSRSDNRSEGRSEGRFSSSRSPKGRSFGGASSPRPGGSSFVKGEMFSAICASCGDPCQVPFKPNGLKQVFCNSCFNKGGEKPAYEPAGNRFSKPGFDRKPSFNPDRDRDRREFRPSGSDQPSNKAQLDRIEAKLEKILDLLGDED